MGMCMIRLKHGLMPCPRNSGRPCFISLKMLLYMTLVDCDGVICGLGVTNWMWSMPGCYSNIL